MKPTTRTTFTTSINTSILGAALGLCMALAGCNTTTEGAAGIVRFTPTDCGRTDGCDLATGLGVGGSALIQIAGNDGFSTVGIDLASDAPDILSVAPVADVNNRPTWELLGVGDGIAHLAAIDPDGVEVDFVEFEVLQPARLGMESFLGNAVGPVLDDPEYDEIWTVNADQQTILLVTPFDAAGDAIMGRYAYVPAIEVLEFDTFLNDRERLGEGYLDFTAPAGSYGVSFADDISGAQLSVLIQVANTQ